MPGVKEEIRLAQSWSSLKPCCGYEEKDVGRLRGVVLLFCYSYICLKCFILTIFNLRKKKEKETQRAKGCFVDWYCGCHPWAMKVLISLSLFRCISSPIQLFLSAKEIPDGFGSLIVVPTTLFGFYHRLPTTTAVPSWSCKWLSELTPFIPTWFTLLRGTICLLSFY